MIIRSTKLTVIISLSCLNCENRMSATNIASDMNAAIAGRRSKASQKKFSSHPGQQKGDLRNQVDLGRRHDDERGEMQARDNGKRRRIATGNRLGKREAAEQCGRGRQHDRRTAVPGNEDTLPQRTAPLS